MPPGAPDHCYLVGLIGAAISGSLSPLLHHAEARRHGVNYTYRLLDIEELGYAPEAAVDLVRSAKDLGYDGLNVTHPCKQVVQSGLDALSPEAELIGAVNTVVFRNGLAIGHNTDHVGFLRGFAAGLPHAVTDKVIQIGAGGAGAAVAYALLQAGTAQLVIADLDEARARELTDRLAPHFPASRLTPVRTRDLANEVGDANGIVNSSPVGMVGHPGMPLDPSLLRPYHWVAEVIYRPLETELMAAARALGCDLLDGGYLTVGQAEAAFELITGSPADPNRMMEDFRAAVSQSEK
ncbi:shikimate dehydrogenase [Micrococcales bacterium 31B]|nr:shikimate dehydrogenase [Micrococcales bacterium 31B]